MTQRRRLMTPPHNYKQLTIGDVIFWTGSEYEVYKYTEIDSVPSTYEPYGIVVVPSHHGWYGDRYTCGIMSCTTMSGENSEKGYAAHYLQEITNTYCFMLDPGVSSMEKLIEEYGLNSKIYVGSDCVIDGSLGTYNNQVIAPYNGNDVSPASNFNAYKDFGLDSVDDEINDDFSIRKDGFCLQDFGRRNNDFLLSCGFDEVSKSTVENTLDLSDSVFANYMGTFCCYKYKAPGDEVFGKWYVPAMGELWYLACKSKLLRNIVSTLRAKYPNYVNYMFPNASSIDYLPWSCCTTPCYCSSGTSTFYPARSSNYNAGFAMAGTVPLKWWYSYNNPGGFTALMSIGKPTIAFQKFKL